jgi:hypothetical protein
MVLQAFMDESYDKHTFVMAGYISSAENWAAFTKDWTELLPTRGLRDKRGQYRFKMSEIRQMPDYEERTSAFARIINDYILGSLAIRLSISDLKSAMGRLFVPGVEIDFYKFADPYFIAFWTLIGRFHQARPEMESAYQNERIDFFFDMHSHKKRIINMWQSFCDGSTDEQKKYYGSFPKFEDDNQFVALQAADLWCWWIRKWHTSGDFFNERNSAIKTGILKKTNDRKILHVDIRLDEESIVRMLTRCLHRELAAKYGHGKDIYDLVPFRGLSS